VRGGRGHRDRFPGLQAQGQLVAVVGENPVGGAFGHAALWGHLALGLTWAAAFAMAGLVIFRLMTRRHPA